MRHLFSFIFFAFGFFSMASVTTVFALPANTFASTLETNQWDYRQDLVSVRKSLVTNIDFKGVSF